MASADTSAGPGPEVALLFIGVSLTIGAFFRQLLRNTRLPYTVALLLVGVALGALDHYVDLGLLGDSIEMWANINPALVFYVFLPALLFESAISMDFHQIKRCIVQMVLLAGPGVFITAALVGVSAKLVLPYDWNWATAMVLGGVLCSTDPVAVVALLRQIGAPTKIRTIIDGESLMNDATSIVWFELFLGIALGGTVSAGSIISFLARVTLGGIALGIAFSIVTLLWLRKVFNDSIIEITLLFTAAYMSFWTANRVTATSGVLSDVTLGIACAIFAKTTITGENEKSMHHFWELVGYIAGTLIFMLSGVVIADKIIEEASHIQAVDWGYAVAMYLCMQLARGLMVLILYPGLGYSGYGMDWKEAVLLVWSGLRGAVALVLALIVSKTQAYDYISEETQARIMFITGVVVFLSLIVNGTTTQFLVEGLRLTKTSEIKKRIREFTKREMYEQAKKKFEDVGEDEELGPADWHTVEQYLPCLNSAIVQEDAQVRLHGEDHRWWGPHQDSRQGRESRESRDALSAAEQGAEARGPRRGIHLFRRRRVRTRSGRRVRSVEDVREQQLQDTRVRFLNGVQASYWTMLEEGRINQTAALLLMQAVAESIDHTVVHHEMGLWLGLRPHIRMPPGLRKLHRWLLPVLPKRVLHWLTMGRLELAAAMSAAFLRACRHAKQQLKNFLKNSSICDQVIKESDAEEIHVKKFLEDVRLNFPEALVNIKTRQVIVAILKELTEYVSDLEETGIMDQREAVHLHNMVESDMKKIIKSPPLVTMPSAKEVLERQPLIGALPVDVRFDLTQPLKDFLKLSESELFGEGQDPEGVWLIASGVAKWTTKTRLALDQNDILPHFAHGTTVGLYECLTGTPHLATVTADSVLHCFFIDRGRILQAEQASTSVADFLWKESALELARFLLPEMVGDISNHDLRLLMYSPDSSRTVKAQKGEYLSLSAREVGLLLLGSVEPVAEEEALKQQSSEPWEESAGTNAKAEDGEVEDAQEFITTIKAPACLTFVAPSQGHYHAEGSTGGSAHGGRVTPHMPPAALMIPVEQMSQGVTLYSTTPHGQHTALNNQASHGEALGAVPHVYRVVSEQALLVALGCTPEDHEEQPGVEHLGSAPATPRGERYRLRPQRRSQVAQDHDNLLRWESPENSDSEGDTAMTNIIEESEYLNTLPPASVLADELARQLREASDVDACMAERALQLSIFGSKMIARNAGTRGVMSSAGRRRESGEGTNLGALAHPL